MRTAVTTADNVSVHLFQDDSNFVITEQGLELDGEIHDGSLNPSNAIIIDGVTPPDDWYGRKYLFVDGEWVDNPNDPVANPPVV